MAGLFRRNALLGLGTGWLAPSLAAAQTILPDKPVHIVLGFSSGSGSDLLTKIIAPKLERQIGRRITVDSKPGGTGSVAGEYLKKSAPDGSTLAFLPSVTLAGKLVAKEFPFDPERDLKAVILAGTIQLAIAASPKIGVETFADYAGWLKSNNPEGGRLGATASESLLDIFGKMIARETGAQLETVPYRSMTALIDDLRDGRIPAAAGVAPSFLEFHRGGKIKILMTSGRKRMKVARDLPTAREAGHPALEMHEWYGFFAPGGTPPGIIAEWNRKIASVLDDKEIASQLSQFGLDVDPSTPEEAAASVGDYLRDWKKRLAILQMLPSN